MHGQRNDVLFKRHGTRAMVTFLDDTVTPSSVDRESYRNQLDKGDRALTEKRRSRVPVSLAFFRSATYYSRGTLVFTEDK